MSTEPAADLLDTWERGGTASPGERALLLLGSAYPQVPAAVMADWTVGRRDAALLALREWMFGPRLDSLASCPVCGEQLEMNLSTADITVGAVDPPAPLTLEEGGYQVTYRLPTAGDMAALADQPDDDTAEQWLLERCVLSARHQPDTVYAAADLPSDVVEALSNAMAEADPQAEVELALRCPDCSHHWSAPFDIVSFLWREVDVWARRTLREVATLASAFGWSEHEILALTPGRRRLYLDLTGL